jgi:NitT/TauT family transport system permease protein
VVVALGMLAVVYAVVMTAHTWSGPFQPATQISHDPHALPEYAARSVLRIAIAYVLSLSFALVYGYVAGTNERAERWLVPLLDILQSIPVLSFLPPVMLAMIALVPGHQLGVELGSIVLIFTGQVWNLAFSFYSSLKSIPRELSEAASIYRLSPLQRFLRLELPFAAIGLVWNSMMSVAGGWFFLMACEMFVLGNRDFRLPGLGSYLQSAANAGDMRAIGWGMATMVGIIVATDQLLWRPIIAWSDKFKFEQVEGGDVPRSAVLLALRRSHLLRAIGRVLAPLSERLMAASTRSARPAGGAAMKGVGWLAAGVGALLAAYGAARALGQLATLSGTQVTEILRGAAASFVRVNGTLLLAALWTVPVGVAIGLRPKLARIMQPLVQIAASVPATALFPVLLLMLIRAGGGLGIGSVLLMLLGTQWYVLFNVIAGAMAIPSDLKEAAWLYRLGTVQRWRVLILPSIFPYLITGMVTASGGAWNASVVAEYVHFNGQVYSTVGLGAVIAAATDSGQFAVVLAATVVMSTLVVTVNRLLWRRMYGLAQTKYKLET